MATGILDVGDYFNDKCTIVVKVIPILSYAVGPDKKAIS